MKYKKLWNFCGIHYINIVDTSGKTYEKNGAGRRVENDGILWLNEKHIDEELDHKNLQETVIKHYSVYVKHKYKLVERNAK